MKFEAIWKSNKSACCCIITCNAVATSGLGIPTGYGRGKVDYSLDDDDWKKDNIFELEK